MNDKPIRDCHGWIRRIDVSLRTRYPNLVTRIFETAPSQYVIVFDKAVRDAASIKKEFHDEIRFITANADISNEIPASYLREIPPLRDDELSHGFAGLPFPLPALFNLISARFPDLPVVSVRDGGTPMKVTVELAEEIDEASKRTLLEFCNGLEAPVPWNLVVSGRAVDAPTLPIPGAKAPPTDALQIRATRLRPQIPKFARQDEVFWFENIDKIYAGTQSWPGQFGQVAKWIFCLRAARMPRIRRRDDQANAPDAHTGIQSEGGFGRREGREDAGRVGAAV